MTSVRKSWFRTSLQDPAFFNSVLSHYAGRFNLDTMQGDPVDSLYFRTNAIKLVNERLSKQDEIITDGTIAAVASLATYEVQLFHCSFAWLTRLT
jgi:hypothetical protein